MRAGSDEGRERRVRALTERLDAICDCFEAAMRAGRGPRIEEYLGLVSGPERVELFRELLALEMELRDRDGTPVEAEEYRHRFPEHSDEVDHLFLGRGAGANETVELPADRRSTTTERSGDPATTLPEGPDRPRREAGRVIGRYMLVERLGGGTQGDVWRAVQLAPFVRTVALKLLPPGTALDGEHAERLRKEAERPSRLTDSAILPIFEFGQADGRCFLSMLLVDGFTLAAVIRQRRDRKAGRTPAELHRLAIAADAAYFPAVATLLARVARALAAAHAAKVVHRDVKPSNILLDRAHEDRVYLADFGLARDLDDPSVHPGYLLGTLLYMPPEKLLGRADADDGRGDIYALGVTLFEAATLARPFDVPGEIAMVAKASFLATTPPKPPRSVEPRLPRDLEAIVLKAMDRNLALRYASATELAEDLERFARGEAVRARPPGPARRAWRRLRRHRVAALAAAALALVAATALTARAVVHARDVQDFASRRRQFQTLRDRAAAALAGGRLDEALDAWSRAALLDGADPGLNDLGGRITEAALREEVDAPEGEDARRVHHIYAIWSKATAMPAGMRRPKAQILFGVRDLAVATDPPGAVVTFRATRRDGRPIDLVLYRLRAGSVDRPATLTEVVPGDLWVTATDPATGAFAERPYHLGRDLNPGESPPPLRLRLPPRGGPARGMVRVAGGSFSMGADDSSTTAEGRKVFPPHSPAHPVDVAPFDLDAREVTRGAFLAWLERTRTLAPKARDRWLAALWPAGPDPAHDDWPMTDVPHDVAVEFAAATGCRLPTEEELEYAARGSTGRRVPEALAGHEAPTGPEWRTLRAVGALPQDSVVAPGGGVVFDLFANASELTLFRYRPYPRATGFRPRSDGWNGFVVRAGLAPVRVRGTETLRPLGFLERSVILPEQHQHSLGFRRARPATPLFADLTPTDPGPAVGGRRPGPESPPLTPQRRDLR
ncbi:MAG TPA: bifunctional serine/threonine-protein kinase/formylglycine-generating enzyme family protein [Isosphaeraceae bacterium]|jgi:serine/threonine-protein kinase|nr:bifunctional serine/threonine-protein kinase/formylglycine-generating enzyme family protein [Isosphaeraceae bacterium]